MTLKEIGALAGVSPAAVSLVLNNKPGVSDEKRAEIQQLLITHHKAAPDAFAAEKNRQILFLKYVKTGYITEENSNFISSVLDEVEASCRLLHYPLRMEVCRAALAESLRKIDYSTLDGMLILGSELDPSTYPCLSAIPVPYVVIDNRMPGLRCNTVTMNNEEMVYAAIAHLAAQGCTDIGYLQSAMPAQNFRDRSEAFHRACRDLQLSCREDHIFRVDPYLMGACESMKRYLSYTDHLPRYLFADNDTIAIGCMKAMQQFGYRVPEDVFVMGFDDILFASIHSPSLSTMRVPKQLMGQIAVQMLHKAMTTPSESFVKQFVDGELVIRHSTTL